jgi:hypothetical protein
MDVGPQHAWDLGLRAEVDETDACNTHPQATNSVTVWQSIDTFGLGLSF